MKYFQITILKNNRFSRKLGKILQNDICDILPEDFGKVIPLLRKANIRFEIKEMTLDATSGWVKTFEHKYHKCRSEASWLIGILCGDHFPSDWRELCGRGRDQCR